MAVIWFFALFAGVSGAILLHHPLFGVLGFAIIAGSTTEVWYGVKYRLSAKSAEARTGLSVSSIDWEDVKRVIVNEVGVTLTPLAADSALSPFRGVFLRFGELGKEQVLEAVNEYGGEHVRSLG